MHNNILYNNAFAIANGFNKYFVEIPKLILLSKLNMYKQDIHEYIANLPLQINIFYLNKIDEFYTLGIINNLKNSNSCD